MTTSIGQWARLVAWRRITWSLVLALLLLICLPMPAALASEPVPHSVSTLPAVTPFSRARFTILYTINSSVISTSLYGGGTYIAPDQVSIWLTNTANTHWNELIQIGTTTYTRTNHGTWQKGSTAGSPMIGTLPIAEQLAWLAHNANGMLSYGNELVGDQTATHYQIWLSGSKLLTLGNTAAALSSTARSLLASSTIKYDLWITPTTGYLIQQNVVVSIPAGTMNSVSSPAVTVSYLITFSDLNDPQITLSAPI